MDPSNVHNVDGFGTAFVTLNIVAVVLVVAGLAYGVLVVMAALGLTSFSMLERFRKKPPEEADEGGIDDLLSSDLRVHPEACTSSCAAGCDVAGRSQPR